jgi:nicotinic acid mononucleotide adenylyltransferase
VTADEIAAELLNLGLADRVCLVPCGFRADKELKQPAATRLHMLRLALAEFFAGCPDRVCVPPLS